MTRWRRNDGRDDVFIDEGALTGEVLVEISGGSHGPTRYLPRPSSAEAKPIKLQELSMSLLLLMLCGVKQADALVCKSLGLFG
jgi:hypothetical protein